MSVSSPLTPGQLSVAVVASSAAPDPSATTSTLAGDFFGARFRGVAAFFSPVAVALAEVFFGVGVAFGFETRPVEVAP